MQAARLARELELNEKVLPVHPPSIYPSIMVRLQLLGYSGLHTVNQHPPVHHRLDARFDSVVDDRQLSQYLVSSW
jgi:hypothetical protein